MSNLSHAFLHNNEKICEMPMKCRSFLELSYVEVALNANYRIHFLLVFCVVS